MLAAVRFRTLASALAFAVALACRQEPDAPAADHAATPATVSTAAAPSDPPAAAPAIPFTKRRRAGFVLELIDFGSRPSPPAWANGMQT